MAAARGIVMSYDKYKLEEFGGHIHLTTHRAYSLLIRIGYVRKATTAESKYRVTQFDQLKQKFLDIKVPTIFELGPNRYQDGTHIPVYNG